jgi:hypothetical protein
MEPAVLTALPPPARGRSTREAGREGVPPRTLNFAVRRDPLPAPSAPPSPLQGEGFGTAAPK